MKKSTLALITATLITPVMGFAQSNTTAAATTNTNTLKADSVQKPTEKMKDIDSEITDARMRAELGSKSRFSFKSSLAYSEASVDDPFNAVRPNYRTSATTEVMTSLSGTVGMNFRATSKDNISFGTGIDIIAPLQGDLSKPAEDTRKGRSGTISRYQIATPYLGWSRGYKALGQQMSSSFTYSYATDSDSVDLLRIESSASFSQTVLATFGQTNWTGGTSLTIGKTFYDGSILDPKILESYNAGSYKRSELIVGLFPFLQYTFNDRYSFRTVFGYLQFARYELSNDNVQLEPYQSVGVGVSVTRDIYLYPNVQFTPKDIRADRTNVALSANINLF